MNIAEFTKTFIKRNTLVRLWYEVPDNVCEEHFEVIEGDKPMMEWELIKSKYKHNTVVGVTDILYSRSPYIEAVNLVIKQD